MSTSKHYPYFGTFDDTINRASRIVHFVAPGQGTVVWVSDPSYDTIGRFSPDWIEPKFVPCNDPFMVKYLYAALESAQKDVEEKKLYILLDTDGNIPEVVSYNVDALKEEARLQTDGGYLMWDQFGKEWNGRDRDQNDSMWLIKPIKLV